MICMRMGFVTGGTLEEYAKRDKARGQDILSFPFQALGEVFYERELRGETSIFEDVALLSKEEKCVVISGCYTNAHGMKRKSAVVADRGRILGVSDMVNRIDAGDFTCGAGVKIFDTAAGRIGVIVAEDLYFPRIAETLSVCGAELTVCIFEECGGIEQVLMRAEAFLYGVPVFLCGYGFAAAADIAGKLAFSSPASPCSFEFSREQEYHLVETRRRGFSRRKKEGF